MLRYFDLEKDLFELCGVKNNFVTIAFDCLREEAPKKAPDATDDEEDLPLVESDERNFYVTYGCPPIGDRATKSSFINNYIKCIEEHLNKTGGVLELPTALEIQFETQSTDRREVTKQLFYDVAKASQEKAPTNHSTTTASNNLRLMKLKKAMLGRIQDKMSGMKQEEEAKSQELSGIIRKAITKDLNGHIVKRLVQRLQ